MLILNVLFQIIIIFYLYKDSLSLNLYGFGSSAVRQYSFGSREEIKRLISNDLSHEIFSQITSANGEYTDASKFFSIGKNALKIASYDINPIDYKNININTIDLYHVSTYYLYLPKLISSQKSVLFAFCTKSHYLSLYEYISPNSLSRIKLIEFEEFKIAQTNNECSASSFLGKNDFGVSISIQKMYISNAYSRYINDDTSKSIFYDIKIFEYKKQTEEVNYYVGKSFKVELINFSTTHPSNFDPNFYYVYIFQRI